MTGLVGFPKLWGQWNIDKLIGKGSYGAVYRATSDESNGNNICAIKHIELPSEGNYPKNLVEKGIISQESEAENYYNLVMDKLYLNLNNNILKDSSKFIKYEDYIAIPKSERVGYDIFIKMEYLTGLEQYIETHKFQESEVIQLGINLCDLLIELNNNSIYHGNIKPSNIFVTRDNKYKLGDIIEGDFLPKITDGNKNSNANCFTAPEVKQGDKADILSDIYSVGMVMYYLLNDCRPVVLQGADGIALPKPCNCSNDSLADIILMACEYSKDKRWSNPTALKNALEYLDKAKKEETAITYNNNTNSVNNLANENVNTFTPPIKKKSPAFLIAVLSIIAVLLVVVGVLIYILLNQNQNQNQLHPEEVVTESEVYTTQETETEIERIEMPSLIGEKYDKVSDELIDMGLVVYTDYEYNDEYEKGVILSQNCAAGSKLEEGTSVTLTISKGPEYCPEEYSQKIEVKTKKGRTTTANMTLYQWGDGEWEELYSCKARVGKDGIGSNYGEGKAVTPKGEFKLGCIISLYEPNSNMDWYEANEDTCIVDDPDSYYYNTICDSYDLDDDVHYDGTIGQFLEDGSRCGYIFIEHNGDGFGYENATPGKGSAITICGCNGSLESTYGCIDISADDFNEIIQYLDIDQNPYIITK